MAAIDAGKEGMGGRIERNWKQRLNEMEEGMFTWSNFVVTHANTRVHKQYLDEGFSSDCDGGSSKAPEAIEAFEKREGKNASSNDSRCVE